MDSKFYYTGNWEEIVEEFGFQKEELTQLEEVVYQCFRLNLTNTFDDYDWSITLEIEKHPEFPDKVYFTLEDRYGSDVRFRVINKDHLKSCILAVTSNEEL